MKSKMIFLSYILDEETPTYGNRNKFICEKISSIKKGDIANDSYIKTTVHIGTHLDLPYHFFDNGQTIEHYEANFFIFNNPLFLEIEPKNLIIKDELIMELERVFDKEKYDILIVKTGICYKRDKEEFWKFNYGFDPIIANYLRENFPKIRVFGFDTISVSSFQHRQIGREAHKAFLDPKRPILLLEDMDLTRLKQDINTENLMVVPLRISKCDGLPCTVIAEIKE